jgi:Ca-activated chloride channel family protein
MTDSRKVAPEFQAGELRLVAGFDRTLIRRRGESVRFLVAEVTAPTVRKSADAVRVPLNLALVIDASGSMSGDPIAAAKEAARLVVASLGADDRLSVVAFDSYVKLLVDGRIQDAAGKAAATLAIAQLEAGSSTNLGGGWLQGCTSVARVMEARAGQALRNRVVVLSDGQANVGMVEPDELSGHASKLRARGLVSSAVGIGEGYSDTQLEAIAASGGGSLHHASLPQEIVELVLGELDELRETVVESCDLVLETPAGFRAELVGDFAVAREARAGGGERLTCVLGALGSGASRAVVVKLRCGAGERGSEAAVQVLARYCRVGMAATEESVETAPVECRLQFATGKECLAQPRDPERALTVATMWQFAIVRAATRLNQDGELARANELVEGELRHFRRYCQGLPGAASMLEALERMQRSIGHEVYAPMMAKEMRVASTKGLRRELDHRPLARASAMWHSHLPTEPRK